jgi:uncharacterized membrane protein YhaH (DUF805 family)
LRAKFGYHDVDDDKQRGDVMGFGESISTVFRNYVNFEGRAPRSEFWYWVLFYILAAIVASIIDYAIASGATVRPLTTLLGLACFLPYLAVDIRRLHDIDRSGWWLLIVLIPLVGGIVLLVWFCMAGTGGPNRFGPDPLAGRG